MKNKKSALPVTHSEFVKETGAIREDLQAVKEAIATKDDFNKLDNKVNGLAGEIIKTQTELKKVEERIETKISTEINKVLDAIDSFAQKAENYDRKALFHGKRIENHEERITQLEKTASK